MGCCMVFQTTLLDVLWLGSGRLQDMHGGGGARQRYLRYLLCSKRKQRRGQLQVSLLGTLLQPGVPHLRKPIQAEPPDMRWKRIASRSNSVLRSRAMACEMAFERLDCFNSLDARCCQKTWAQTV